MTNREEGGGSDTANDDDLMLAIKTSLDILTNNLASADTNAAAVTTTAAVTTNGVSEQPTQEQTPSALVHNNPIISLVASLGDFEKENNNNINDSEAAATTTTSAVNSPSDVSADQAVVVEEGEDAVNAVEKLNLKNNNNNNLNSSANNESWTENPPSSASSGFSDDDSLAGSGDGGDYKTIDQVVQMVRERGRGGLMAEYAEIKMRAPEGTFTNARLMANMNKNRYTDVLCYDHSRVVLAAQQELSGDDINGLMVDSVDGMVPPPTDYINANFVDGYKQKNAYISTQGPLPKTSADFWRMVWEQQCLVIVMTTRVNERGRIKCGQYWDTQENSAIEFGHFRIYTTDVVTNEDYTVATLELTNLKVSVLRRKRIKGEREFNLIVFFQTEETRKVSHWQFTSWPDYGVPNSAMAMLTFLQRVRDQQATMVKALGSSWNGHPRGPPIVVHCSAGIGRTGEEYFD